VHDYFEDDARRLLNVAREEAATLGSGAIGPEHLLLAAANDRNAVGRMLRELGIDDERVRARMSRGSHSATAPEFSVETREALSAALRKALSLGDDRIGPHHVILALASEDDGPVPQMIRRLGVSCEQLRSSVLRLLSGQTAPSEVVHQAQLDAFHDLLGPMYDTIASLPGLVQREFARPADEGDLLLALAAPENLVGRAFARLGLTTTNLREALVSERGVPSPAASSDDGDSRQLAERHAELRAAIADAVDGQDFELASTLRDELSEVRALASDHAARRDREILASARSRLGKANAEH